MAAGSPFSSSLPTFLSSPLLPLRLPSLFPYFFHPISSLPLPSTNFYSVWKDCHRSSFRPHRERQARFFFDSEPPPLTRPRFAQTFSPKPPSCLHFNQAPSRFGADPDLRSPLLGRGGHVRLYLFDDRVPIELLFFKPNCLSPSRQIHKFRLACRSPCL